MSDTFTCSVCNTEQDEAAQSWDNTECCSDCMRKALEHSNALFEALRELYNATVDAANDGKACECLRCKNALTAAEKAIYEYKRSNNLVCVEDLPF